MFAAAENLEFEKAARLRDQLRMLKADQGVSDLIVVDSPSPGRAGRAAQGKSTGRAAARGRARPRPR